MKVFSLALIFSGLFFCSQAQDSTSFQQFTLGVGVKGMSPFSPDKPLYITLDETPVAPFNGGLGPAVSWGYKKSDSTRWGIDLQASYVIFRGREMDVFTENKFFQDALVENTYLPVEVSGTYSIPLGGNFGFRLNGNVGVGIHRQTISHENEQVSYQKTAPFFAGGVALVVNSIGKLIGKESLDPVPLYIGLANIQPKGPGGKANFVVNFILPIRKF